MFYTYNVDISNTKEMFNFLNNHFTYFTMNSWNGTRSIANNVKLHRLALRGDWTKVYAFLCDQSDRSGLGINITEMISDWEYSHPGYKCGFKGRSGGYLVLYEEGSTRSILPDCISDYDNYEDFKADAKDNYGGVKYLKDELRSCVELVRDFDKLCDELRDLVDDYSTYDLPQIILDSVIEEFNDYYEDDLNMLNFERLTVVNGKVDISDIVKMRSLLDGFIRLFASYDNLVMKTDNTFTFWLEER